MRQILTLIILSILVLSSCKTADNEKKEADTSIKLLEPPEIGDNEKKEADTSIKLLEPPETGEDSRMPHIHKSEPVAMVLSSSPSKEMIDGEITEYPLVETEIKTPDTLIIEKTEKFPYQKTEDTDMYPALIEYLDKIIEFCKANEGYEIRIVGYSDNTLSTSKNFRLSQSRAENVVNYLLSKGLSRRLILSTGRGATNPLARNDTEQGRRKNRRVEILVVEGR